MQTYLASSALVPVMPHFFPVFGPLADHKFVGLSYPGWIGFMIMWVLRAIAFWFGMEAIKKFIDWAGPAV